MPHQTVAERVKAIRGRENERVVLLRYKSCEVVLYGDPDRFYRGKYAESFWKTLISHTNRDIVFIDMASQYLFDYVAKEKKTLEEPYFIFYPNTLLRTLYKDSPTKVEAGLSTYVKFNYLRLQEGSFYSKVYPILTSLNSGRLKSSPSYDCNIYLKTDIQIRYARLYADFGVLSINMLDGELLEEDTKQLLHNFGQLVKTFFEGYDVRGTKITPEYIQETAENYVAFVQEAAIQLMRSVQNSINVKNQDMSSQYKALVRLEKEISELAQSLLSLEAKKKIGEDSFLSQDVVLANFQNLLVKGKFKKFQFGMGYVFGFTDNVYVESHGKKYLVGQFRITIQQDGVIKLDNLTHKKGSYDHPHISSGIPCLGSIKEVVPKLINKGDFIELFILLYNYLTSYANGYDTAENPHAKLEKYWGETGDYCDNCCRGTRACRCVVCVHCGLTNQGPEGQDCKCEKCPSCNYSIQTCVSRGTCGRCEECTEIKQFVENKPVCKCVKEEPKPIPAFEEEEIEEEDEDNENYEEEEHQ